MDGGGRGQTTILAHKSPGAVAVNELVNIGILDFMISILNIEILSDWLRDFRVYFNNNNNVIQI